MSHSNAWMNRIVREYEVGVVYDVGSMVPQCISLDDIKAPEETCLVAVLTTQVPYPALVVRHTKADRLWHTVYVGVPKHHPWYRREDYDEINDMHPELKYRLSYAGSDLESRYREVHEELKRYTVDHSLWYFGTEVYGKEDVGKAAEEFAQVLYRVSQEEAMIRKEGEE